MLKTFRDNLKHLKWTLWIVIAAFIIFYIPDLMTPGGPGTHAATVGDDTVAYTELERVVRQQEEQYRQFLDQPGFREQIRRRAIEQLVNSKLLLMEARDMGLEVTDEELRREIVRNFSRDGRFIGTEEYTNLIRSQRMNVDDFEDGIREQLLIQKLIAALASNVFVSDSEVEAAYREDVERAKIRFVRLTGDRFTGQVTVSDEEARAYFGDNRETYRRPEQRDVAYLLVNTNELRGQVEVTDRDLTAYYDSHRQDFERQEQVRVRQIFVKTDGRTTAEARQVIEDARGRIAGGESFADVARDLSEDPASQPNGGELGFIGRGQMPPEFEEAAFSAPVGELVGPVEAAFGVHLLEVEQKREGGMQPFEEVRGQLRNRVIAERLPQLVEQRAAALKKRIEDEGAETAEQLQAIAESEEGVTFQDLEPVSRDQPIPAMGRAQGFLDAVFSTDAGDVTDPVAVPQGRAVALVEEELAERDPEFEEVADEVKQTLSQQRSRERAIQALADAKTRVDGGASLDDVAAELDAQVQETAEFGAQGMIQNLGFNPQVARAALGMEVGEVGGPYEAGNGAVLFEVTERTAWDPAAFEEEKDSARSQIEQEKLSRFLESVMRQRRDEVEVQIDPNILQDPDGAGA
jgi:peptidyl-prolyl cis-trans isomerase D